jgi:murein DD-endopeptidase MepM/ murein hydrolase activator NlpD
MLTLLTVAVLTTALGACEDMMYGARDGTIEYPGSAAGPNAVPVYVTKSGDTVDSISERYGVAAQTIIDRNGLQAPYKLKGGQNLMLPGARVVAPAAQTAAAAPRPSSSGPVKQESLPPPGESKARPPETRPEPAAGQPTPLSPPAREVTVAATPPRFEWPVHGKVVSAYGGSGSQKNDGIDIAAARGTPVKAADSGTVVYAGDEVKNMGNLVLVSHRGGYITAYGNNESLLVKKGDTVTRGQTIAKVGATAAGEGRLHFEVRHASKTVDPVSVLPGQ